jgi:hypothetical protein
VTLDTIRLLNALTHYSQQLDQIEAVASAVADRCRKQRAGLAIIFGSSQTDPNPHLPPAPQTR